MLRFWEAVSYFTRSSQEGYFCGGFIDNIGITAIDPLNFGGILLLKFPGIKNPVNGEQARISSFLREAWATDKIARVISMINFCRKIIKSQI